MPILCSKDCKSASSEESLKLTKPPSLIKKRNQNTDSKMFRSFAGKIQKGISRLASKRPSLSYLNEEHEAAATVVPDDVMEGHFAVLAIKGEEIKRFIIELECLADPEFMVLLDEAKEEYGFTQKGALAVPCRPQELQKILDDRRRAEITGRGGCYS